MEIFKIENIWNFLDNSDIEKLKKLSKCWFVFSGRNFHRVKQQSRLENFKLVNEN